ncbi:MAG: non-canonical purine NTP pyrophosphatase, RdgB/HAM1 family [candidate division Zixibacteria bacterium RBG_16_40_9]|nr:MAG: non-canonical purine NTP pyrophosphatase, RdgB/HAM1 family [candidate division Zixibacteria bacterium RBG_16_40_9]
MKLVLATQNKDKVREIKNFLSGLKIQILTLDDSQNNFKIKETGKTLEENAILKADAVYKLTKLPTLADDSGLEVQYLKGKPGVRSSRFAGEKATYSDNNLKLLKLLKGVPVKQRKAQFRCVMALKVSENKIKLLEGKVSGYIATELKGKNGFGYDPLFYIPKLKKTFAQLSLKQKNKLSHRAKALQKVKKYLQSIIKD